jgi:hypothetical protein
MPSFSYLFQIGLAVASIIAAAPAPQASDRPVTTVPSAFSTGTKGLPLKTDIDNTGGSGPYKATIFTDPTLPRHTIYAPKTPPPADVKMPVIVWGNGLCAAMGTFFYNFLAEIASHGYIVYANLEYISYRTISPCNSIGFIFNIKVPHELVRQYI